MEVPFVTVTFSHPVLVGSDLILFIDERPVMVTWKTPEGKQKPSLVWVCDVPKDHLSGHCQHNIKVIWKDGETKKECTSYPGKRVTWFRDSVTEENIFSLELSEGKSSVLQQELQSCKELQELEPDNKWCLLTIILLMRALDPLLYEVETLHYFDTLKAVDPMRSGYYDDLRSKFQMENAILKMEYAESNLIIVLDKVLEVDNNEVSHLEGVCELTTSRGIVPKMQ
ncbi:unnamed protein product [Staurois parvus]|uniref:Geranylgeranyl transferase type-2 subunit alpha n=1 Tax=Staurois parvus TaxID=386267 RepID=A0ABN9FM06_9NEOB|nr:unnamed protein product [Staurois parvus]